MGSDEEFNRAIENRRHNERIPLPGVVNTGAIFGHDDGVYIGAIKADGRGLILSNQRQRRGA